MKRKIEYISYSDSERLEMLENRAAELERMLGRPTPGYATTEPGTGAYPVIGHGVIGHGSAVEADTEHFGHVDAGAHGGREDIESGHWAGPGYRDSTVRHPDTTPWYVAVADDGIAGHMAGLTATDAEAGGYESAGYEAVGYEADYPGAAAPGEPEEPEEPDERTEVLINHGRRNVRRSGRPGWLRHWRAIAIVAAGVAIGSFMLTVILPSGDATWPASVARVQSEITVACENPNVASEPTQVNFACAKGTRQILWVFSLLTSNNNPNFSDSSNGRKGLEPISPTQGGDVAWSLNLHHPYNPSTPTDSLQVAARAINNIIGGATLTSNNGAAVVQPGLESKPANCARYTGSSALVTRQGFPAICARPVTSPAGQAALVSDVFEQWMVGAPARVAAEAGVLFVNVDNPGDSRVQAILNSLPRIGL